MRLEAKQPPAGVVLKRPLSLPGKGRGAYREKSALGPYPYTGENVVRAPQPL
jgi:hypothetical protein